MNEGDGLISGIVKFYQDFKLSVVDKFSNMDLFSIEAPFLDEFYINEIINDLEKQYASASHELRNIQDVLKDDAYGRSKINDILTQKKEAAVQIAFYMALDEKRVNEAVELLGGIDDDFRICLDALSLFYKEDYVNALETAFLYIKEIGKIPEHYLFNRNLAEMLIQDTEYKKAIPFLRKASEKMPESLELHKTLLECYRREGMSDEMEIELQIIDLLEG
jgi:tetratricopeptide (TPR) repeat protein